MVGNNFPQSAASEPGGSLKRNLSPFSYLNPIPSSWSSISPTSFKGSSQAIHPREFLHYLQSHLLREQAAWGHGPWGPVWPFLTGPVHFISNLKLPSGKQGLSSEPDPALLEDNLVTRQLLLGEAPSRTHSPASPIHAQRAFQEGDSVQTLSLFSLFVLVPSTDWHWEATLMADP